MIHRHLINLMVFCKYSYRIPELLGRLDELSKDPKYARYMDYLEQSVSLMSSKVLDIVSMPYPKIYFKLCLCLNIHQVSIGSLIIVFIAQRINSVRSLVDRVLFVSVLSCGLFAVQIFTDQFLSNLKRKNLYYRILKGKRLKLKDEDSIPRPQANYHSQGNMKKFREDN